MKNNRNTLTAIFFKKNIRCLITVCCALMGSISLSNAQTRLVLFSQSSGASQSTAGNVSIVSAFGQPLFGSSSGSGVSVMSGYATYSGIMHLLNVNASRPLAPKIFFLQQNFPNPFNPLTTIEFTVPYAGEAVLKVYNSVGQEVATLFHQKAEAGEYHRSVFDARNLASGIYFARLMFDGRQQLRKLVLLK